jgi:16S rRNA C967 or C1407 C5-methylase (RsmB/RsmF family)
MVKRRTLRQAERAAQAMVEGEAPGSARAAPASGSAPGSSSPSEAASTFATFLARLAPLCPPECWDGVVASFSADKPLVFRLNPLVAPVAETEAALREVVAAAVGPDRVASVFRPLSEAHPFFVAALPPEVPRRLLTDAAVVTSGAAYIQNPSSLLPALALSPAPHHAVLDLCAAPGGKTLHLAALMGLPPKDRVPQGPTTAPSGHLAAVEAVRARFFKLRHLLDRYGAGGTRTYLKDGIHVGAATGPRFDRVLLDAPCASEARIDPRDASSHATWSPQKVQACAHKQAALLRSAFSALKPGGRLVYCTCSFSREENEDVLAAFLAETPAARLVDAGLDGLDWTAPPPLGEGLRGLSLARRVWPDGLWDGFFLAVLEKAA